VGDRGEFIHREVWEFWEDERVARALQAGFVTQADGQPPNAADVRAPSHRLPDLPELPVMNPPRSPEISSSSLVNPRNRAAARHGEAREG
jgi:hypothetical protein